MKRRISEDVDRCRNECRSKMLQINQVNFHFLSMTASLFPMVVYTRVNKKQKI